MHPRCICNLLLMVTIHIYIQLGGDHLAYAHPLTVQPSQGTYTNITLQQGKSINNNSSNTSDM